MRIKFEDFLNRFKPDAKAERLFEKKHIERQRAKYLNIDVLERIKWDKGYREKLCLIEEFLNNNKTSGYILDIGSNTSGEAEVLFSRGHNMVATDINEIALSYSKIRSKKFRNSEMDYFAVDVHDLPFSDCTFDNIVAFEVLHHFDQVKTAMSELIRVLKPGGRLFTIEPYAYNPYRRIAELRFYILGSIERSFSKRGLSNIFIEAGFKIVNSKQTVLPPSVWKKKNVSKLRALLKEYYYKTSVKFPHIFGNLLYIVEKPKSVKNEINVDSIYDRLVCPITKTPLEKREDEYISTNDEGPRYKYKQYSEIPVLIKEDAEKCS